MTARTKTIGILVSVGLALAFIVHQCGKAEVEAENARFIREVEARAQRERDEQASKVAAAEREAEQARRAREAAEVAPPEQVAEFVATLRAQRSIELGAATASILGGAVGRTVVIGRTDIGYQTIQANKDAVMLSLNVDVTTSAHDAALPCVLVYWYASKPVPRVEYVAAAEVYFRRWDSYGSSLGNQRDQGNDFAMHDTVKFTYAVQVPRMIVERENVLVAVATTGSLVRLERRYEPPTYEGVCKPPIDIVTAARDGRFKVAFLRRAGKVVEESY